MTNIIAYKEGWNAQRAGLSADCPYEDETIRNSWLEGYYDAKENPYVS